MSRRSVFLWTLQSIGVAALLGATVASAPADVVYREVFPNGTGANQDISNTGWQAFWGNPPSASDSINTLLIGGIAGKPTDATPINSDPVSPELVNGWFYTNAGPDAGNRNFIFTTESGLVSQSISTGQLSEISWYAANAETLSIMRVAVQVGSGWYGSQQTFNNSTGTVSGATFPTDAELFTLNAATATWFPITFTPGTELSINTSSGASLPSGTVAGVGLYVDSAGGSGIFGLRIDTFSVSTVPEPCSMALASCGLLAIAACVLQKYRHH